jgi:hypothetical protein
MSREADEVWVDEIEHLYAENKRLKAQNAEAAVFLDGMADTFDMYSDHEQDAADCRAMAARLRGDGNTTR